MIFKSKKSIISMQVSLVLCLVLMNIPVVVPVPRNVI